MGRIKSNIISVVLLLFSALAVVLSLLAAARITELSDRSEKLQKEIHEIKQENVLLQSGYDNEVSLDYLEQYAKSVLGMQRISPDQIIYLEKDEDVVIG